jgi:hypothetical protein
MFTGKTQKKYDKTSPARANGPKGKQTFGAVRAALLCKW